MFSAFSQDTFDYSNIFAAYSFSADTSGNFSEESLKTSLWNADMNMNSDNLYHSEMCLCESVYDELFTINFTPEKKKIDLKKNKLI